MLKFKKDNFKFISLILILSLFIFTTLGCGNSKDNSSNSNSNAYKVGDEVKQGDIAVKVNSVKTETVNNFSEKTYIPSEGNKFVYVDITITNNSKADVTLSSILNFTLYRSDGFSCDLAVLPNDKSLDTAIAAGGSLEGVLQYEIDAAAKEASLSIQTNSEGNSDTVNLTFE